MIRATTRSIATHGGAALLQFPQILKQQGTALDLEVARLSTSTDDGHPLLTLGLRSPPEAREADRQALTFVFAVDDSFVVRSDTLRTTQAEARLGLPLRVRPSGRPPRPSLVSSRRSRVKSGPSDWMWRSAGSGRSPRPSSPSNLSWPASSRARSIGSMSFEPSTATLLDWYWLAFVAGGISLAGGSGLALGSRYRERRRGIGVSSQGIGVGKELVSVRISLVKFTERM